MKNSHDPMNLDLRCTSDMVGKQFGRQYETDWMGKFYNQAPYKIPVLLLPMLRNFQKGDDLTARCYSGGKKLSIPYAIATDMLSVFAVELALLLLPQEKKEAAIEKIGSHSFVEMLRERPYEERNPAVFDEVLANFADSHLVLHDDKGARIQNTNTFTNDLHGQLDFLNWFMQESMRHAPSVAQQKMIQDYHDQLSDHQDESYEANSLEDYERKLKWMLKVILELYAGTRHKDQPPLLQIMETHQREAIKDAGSTPFTDPSHPPEQFFIYALEHYIELKYYNVLTHAFDNTEILDQLKLSGRLRESVSSSDFHRLFVNYFFYDTLTILQIECIEIEDIGDIDKEVFNPKSRGDIPQYTVAQWSRILNKICALTSTMSCEQYLLRRLKTITMDQLGIACEDKSTAFEWFGSANLNFEGLFEELWESYLRQIQLYTSGREGTTEHIQRFQKRLLAYIYIKEHHTFSNQQEFTVDERRLNDALKFLSIQPQDRPNLTSDMINKSYRKLTLTCHPDRHPDKASVFHQLTTHTNYLHQWLERQTVSDTPYCHSETTKEEVREKALHANSAAIHQTNTTLVTDNSATTNPGTNHLSECTQITEAHQSPDLHRAQDTPWHHATLFSFLKHIALVSSIAVLVIGIVLSKPVMVGVGASFAVGIGGWIAYHRYRSNAETPQQEHGNHQSRFSFT